MRFLLCIALAALVVSCRDGGTAVPRPVGYPRGPEHSAVYDTLPLPPFRPLAVSADAHVTVKKDLPGNKAVDITYPAYGATVYVTLLQADGAAQLHQMWQNRLERIATNLGGASATRHVDGAGPVMTLTVTATAATQTPVQFLAADTVAMRLVTATAWLSAAATAANLDSLAPTVAALRTDLSNLLILRP